MKLYNFCFYFLFNITIFSFASEKKETPAKSGLSIMIEEGKKDGTFIQEQTLRLHPETEQSGSTTPKDTTSNSYSNIKISHSGRHAGPENPLVTRMKNELKK